MTETTPDYRELLRALGRRYPTVFDVSRERPLKVGICEDLVAAGLTEDEAVVALRAWTRRRGYHLRMTEGAARIDLDGNECGTVTAEQAEHARDRLASIAAKKARKAAAQTPGPKRDGLAGIKAAAEARSSRVTALAASTPAVKEEQRRERAVQARVRRLQEARMGR